MRYPIWTTKKGERIPINKMSDSHLINSLRMLKRLAGRERENTILSMGLWMGALQGEMATYYAEQDFDRACRSCWMEFTPPIFEKMQELAEKRGLQWEENNLK